jgi:21S rRNA (GM2251-2'-O)-methyltransferase
MDNLYGFTPVLNALTAKRRASFVELLVQERSGEGSSSKLTLSADQAKVVDLAEAMGIPVSTVPKHDLNMLSDNRPHQGVMLTASPLDIETLSVLLPAADSSKPPCWLALDEVVDPQNLGALLRSACFLGATGVVVCAKNSASLSPVVSKASAGALEIAPLHSTRNMPRFLAQSAQNGWKVVGTTLGEGSIPLRELEVNVQPTILVLGNEGAGLRTLVQRACTTLVNIEKAAVLSPHGFQDGGDDSRSAGVDSLNVAVSGGILLYHLLA